MNTAATAVKIQTAILSFGPALSCGRAAICSSVKLPTPGMYTRLVVSDRGPLDMVGNGKRGEPCVMCEDRALWVQVQYSTWMDATQTAWLLMQGGRFVQMCDSPHGHKIILSIRTTVSSPSQPPGGRRASLRRTPPRVWRALCWRRRHLRSFVWNTWARSYSSPQHALNSGLPKTEAYAQAAELASPPPAPPHVPISLTTGMIITARLWWIAKRFGPRGGLVKQTRDTEDRTDSLQAARESLVSPECMDSDCAVVLYPSDSSLVMVERALLGTTLKSWVPVRFTAGLSDSGNSSIPV